MEQATLTICHYSEVKSNRLFILEPDTTKPEFSVSAKAITTSNIEVNTEVDGASSRSEPGPACFQQHLFLLWPDFRVDIRYSPPLFCTRQQIYQSVIIEYHKHPASL